MPAFSIVGDLLLRTGSFVTDTDRAAKSLKTLEQRAKDFQTAFRASFAGNVLSGAVQELVSQLAQIPGKFAEIVEEAGKFKDIGDRIGETGEAVASYTKALVTSGANTEQLADFSVRLTKALSNVDEESDKAARALKAIGLNFEDFKRLQPAEQIDAIAKALGQFARGPEQTAVLEALVKGGSQLLPFFKELQESGGRQITLTQKQIDIADEYSDRLARQSASLKVFLQTIAIDAIPALTALKGAFVDLIEEFVKTDQATKNLTGQSAVAKFAEDAALFIAKLVDSLRGAALEIQAFIATTKKEFAGLQVLDARAKQFFTLGFGGGDELKAALASRNAAVADANKALLAQQQFDSEKFQNLVRKQFSAQLLTGERLTSATDPRSTTFGKPILPRINTAGLAGTGKGSTDDPTKKLLDNQLKALEAAIKREQDLLSDRNKFLDLFNAQGLVAIRDYYDAQLTIIDEATRKQVAAYDAQIAALQKFRDAASKQTDKAEATGKIADIEEKRARLVQQTGLQEIEISIKRAEAERKFAEQIESTRANLLELQGDLGKAAAIRFDQQNLQLRNRAIAEGNDELLKMFDTLRKATIAQAEFTKQQTDAQRVVDSLANQEDRIAISRQLGATTELGALKQLGDARQKAIAQLEIFVQKQEEIAKASENPALIQNAERARIELEKLKAVADPLSDKFRSIFAEGAASGIEVLLNNITKGKDALKAFSDYVVQQINRIVAQSAGEALFGKGGLFDIGGVLGGAFGGGSNSAGGAAGAAGQTAAIAASTTATTAQTAALTASTTALAAFTAAVQAASVSSSSSGAADFAGSALSDFIDFGAFFEEGGSPGVGQLALGGEAGAELFSPSGRFKGEAKVAAMFQAGGRGDVARIDGPALIGQNGPQFFRPTVPGVVIPADETARILGHPGALHRHFAGARAGGGGVLAGRDYLGGESGAEMFRPSTSNASAPTGSGGSWGQSQPIIVNQYFDVEGAPDRRTRSQIATDAAHGLETAQRNL